MFVPPRSFLKHEISAHWIHFISWQWQNMSSLSKFISFDPISEFEHYFGNSHPRKLLSRAWDALGNSTLAPCFSGSFFTPTSPNKVVLSAICAPKYVNNSCIFAAICDHFHNYFWACGKDISTPPRIYCSYLRKSTQLGSGHRTHTIIPGNGFVWP